MGYIGSRSSKTFMTNDLVEGRDRTFSDVLGSICVGFSVNVEYCMHVEIIARSVVYYWTCRHLTGKRGLGAGKIASKRKSDERTTPRPSGKVLKERAFIQTWRSKSIRPIRSRSRGSRAVKKQAPSAPRDPGRAFAAILGHVRHALCPQGTSTGDARWWPRHHRSGHASGLKN
jgi:hypothetical protein